MNQPNSPVMSPRPTTAVEAPDFLAVLRRHVWLLVAGVFVGSAVAAGLFLFCRKYYPTYTASVPFQILEPTPPIGTENSTPIIMTSEEASQIINRQVFIMSQDPLLWSIINDEDFRKDYNDPNNPDKKSGWLMEYGPDLKQIKKDLRVNPKMNAGSYEITMTTRDPGESSVLVRAAVKVYLKHLDEDTKNTKAIQQQHLNDALVERVNLFKIHSDSLQDYANARGIDVLKSGMEIEKAALQGLNTEWTRADAGASAAKAEYDAIVAQREELEKSGKKLSEMKLSPEMEQYLEADPLLRSRLSQKLDWEVELAAAEKNLGASGTQKTNEIKARIAQIQLQIDEQRDDLHTKAAAMMETRALQDSVSKRTLASKFDELRLKKETSVRSIGQELMTYQQKVDDLKEEQDFLNKMKQQNNRSLANRFTDDTRVHQMGEASLPNEVTFPKWYVFLPLGAFAGLGLSTLLAYLLVLTDTRVRTPRDISRTLQLPMLGFVPDESDDRTLSGDVETAIISSPASMVAESFRQIRSHITAQTAHNPINTLLVASITPGGGSTTVAANLAAAMALNDLRVLLVEANFYRPSLPRVFKNMPAEGLAEALTDSESLAASIVAHPNLPKLHLLGAGSQLDGASSEMFEAKSFRELLEHLKSKYDLVIFDGAPLNLVSDSLVLAARVDAVVSVVRAGEVSRGAVSRVREHLRGVHANLLGFVLNAAQTSSVGYFKENYRTFYRYAGKGPRNQAGSR